MTEFFSAGITISLIDKVSAGLGQMALSMTKTQAAADALTARMALIGKTFTSGLILGGAGAALAAPLVYATHKAMDLQTAMGRVQIATGASNEQMKMLNDTLTKTANATGIFSKPKLASFAADMYSSGIRDVNQINTMLPLFAKGADIMKILSHGKISPEEAAHTFSALAHQFGRYDAASMKPIVEATAAMAPALPGGLRTLKGMGSYVNIMGSRAMGIDPVQLMALQAAVAQTSGGTGTGRGALSGANLINFLQRSMPGVFGSGLLSGKSAFAAASMGLGDKYGASTSMKDGKLDLTGLQQKIASFEKLSSLEMAKRMKAHVGMLGKKAGDELPLINRAIATGGAGVSKQQLLTQLLRYQFGSASTMAMLMGDEKFNSLLGNIQGAVAKNSSGGIDAMQEKAMKMLEPQLLRVQTNFETLASTIGTHMIPVVTVAATKLGDFLDRLNSFVEDHPKLVQVAVSLMALASGALLLGGAIRIIQAGFMGLQFITSPAGRAILGLVKGFGLFTPQGLLLSAAILGLIVVMKNWDAIVAFAKKNVDYLKVGLVMLADGADLAIRGIKWLTTAIGGFINGLLGMLNLPQLSMPKIDQGVLDYSNKRLAQMGMLKGMDDWAKSGQKPLNNVVPFKAPAKMPPPPLFMPPPLKTGTTNITNNHNYTVHQVPGHDHEACARTLTKKAMHIANGTTGNSVTRSLSSQGNYRP